MLLNNYARYQTGLTMNGLFPRRDGVCACGCNKELPNIKRKWYSDECRDYAYIYFSIIKGDMAIIREMLFAIDQGACRRCGVITEDWQADHIVPVFMGGGACDISNFQTLCLDCHKEKTSKVIGVPTIM